MPQEKMSSNDAPDRFREIPQFSAHAPRMMACIGDMRSTPHIAGDLDLENACSVNWRPGDDILFSPEDADASPKISQGYESCVGWLIAAKEKDTGRELSVLGHQLAGRMTDNQNEALNSRLEKFLQKIDPETLSIVIFAGAYTPPPKTPGERFGLMMPGMSDEEERSTVDSIQRWAESLPPEAIAGMDSFRKLENNNYLEAVNSLGKLFRRRTGLDPIVISGPNVLAGRTAIHYRTSQTGIPRRLFVIRDLEPKRSNIDQSFPASDALAKRRKKLEKRLEELPDA